MWYLNQMPLKESNYAIKETLITVMFDQNYFPRDHIDYHKLQF